MVSFEFPADYADCFPQIAQILAQIAQMGRLGRKSNKDGATHRLKSVLRPAKASDPRAASVTGV